MPERLILGVDVGGTKVAAGLVDPRGRVVFRTRAPMVANGNAAAGFAAVKEAIEAVFAANPQAKDNLEGIGICSPGPLDPRAGVVLNPPNLPCWRNFPLAAEVKRAFGMAARVENDANAAALAEAMWGAGANYRNLFYATIGTGIGTGIIFDKKIYWGRTGSAAEGGHMTIDRLGPVCACGKRGCIETLASGTALARRARERLTDEPAVTSNILGLADRNADAITAETISAAHQSGDALATQLLAETADCLAVWLGNIIDLLEPDAMVIGGGMSAMLEPWFARIQEKLPAWCVNQRCGEIPLLRAAYGEDSGIAGAAAVAIQGTNE